MKPQTHKGKTFTGKCMLCCAYQSVQTQTWQVQLPSENSSASITCCINLHWSTSYDTFTFTYPLTAGAIGTPQMTSQPVSSIFLFSPLPSGTWWTPGLSTPRYCLPTSFSVCLVFFPLSLCLARWFWPDLKNRRHVHTTSVCDSTMVRSSCGPLACWILAQTSSLVIWSLYEMHSI